MRGLQADVNGFVGATAETGPRSDTEGTSSENQGSVHRMSSRAMSADESATAAALALPPAIRNLARAVAPFIIYDGDEALARMEYVDAF